MSSTGGAPLNRRAHADICRVVAATEHRRTRTLARARHAAAAVEWQFRLAALPTDPTERGTAHPTCKRTEGVPVPTDTPQIGYLRSLAAKRDGAFLYTPQEHRAAWQEWTATHPQWTAAHKPIRSNRPEAGQAGWEWESVAPEGRGKLALCVMLVCGAVVAGLVWAGLRWRAGVTW